ncbi:GAF domain-containing protein [Saccharopolyspora sp. NPDC002376]
MRPEHLDTAPEPADRRYYARALASARDDVLSGQRPRVPVRSSIIDSWQRVRGNGLDPDRGRDVDPVPLTEVEWRRQRCGLAGDPVRTLRTGLLPAADSAGHIVVVVDRDGRLLWREGNRAVLRRADQLGFVEGASWGEGAVGTNAIGTALVEGRPLHVHATEHYVGTHHLWTCAAAPVHDPRDGRLLGVVDISGPRDTAHPSMLALVSAVAEMAEVRLREAHRDQLDRLRTIAAPLLARLPGQALVVDRNGWVAASTGLPPIDRVALPAQLDAQRVWVPAFGDCVLEPLPEGVLLRPGGLENAASARVMLDLRGVRPQLAVHRDSGSWSYQVSARHADVLAHLAEHPAGCSAADLAAHLFADPSRTVTVRAEMSRLRKRFGDLLDHRPYRFRPELDVAVLR